jgi:hypothetical protein
MGVFNPLIKRRIERSMDSNQLIIVEMLPNQIFEFRKTFLSDS